MNVILNIGIGFVGCISTYYLFKRIVNCCCSKNNSVARAKKDDDNFELFLQNQPPKIFARTVVPQDFLQYNLFLSDLNEEILAGNDIEENLKVLVHQCDNKTKYETKDRSITFGTYARVSLDTIIGKSSGNIQLATALAMTLTDYIKNINGRSFKLKESLLQHHLLPKFVKHYCHLINENPNPEYNKLEPLISDLIDTLKKEIPLSEGKAQLHFVTDMVLGSLEILEVYAQKIDNPSNEIIEKLKDIISLINTDLKDDFAKLRIGDWHFNLMNHYLSSIYKTKIFTPKLDS